jgi:predicted RNA-binding protein with RPS1 domain
MGYHVIIPQSAGIAHHYVEDIRAFAYIDDITEAAIIYEAPESQCPRLRLEDPHTQKYVNHHYRLGIKTENLFKEQAKRKKFIIMDIDQSKEEFSQYKNSLDDDVKRGDFLIRNPNTEVEVKCRSIHEKKGESYFHIMPDDIRKHLNMMKYTRTPVILAVYKRELHEPDPDTLYMIEIESIKMAVEENLICLTKNGYYAIPLSLTTEGFGLLERMKSDS